MGTAAAHCRRRLTAVTAEQIQQALDSAEKYTREEVAWAMRAEGVEPALVYAFERTGLLVTEETQSLFSEASLGRWDAALREFDER